MTALSITDSRSLAKFLEAEAPLIIGDAPRGWEEASGFAADTKKDNINQFESDGSPYSAYKAMGDNIEKYELPPELNLGGEYFDVTNFADNY